MNYLLIEPIIIGELKEKTANAIYWSINLTRNQEDAVAYCNLLFVDYNGSIDVNENFSISVPNNILQQWGASDDIIDDWILTYSPLFKKKI